MITDYNVLEALKQSIESNALSTILEIDEDFAGTFGVGNVEIDDPDPDNMAKDDMLWITPDNETHENLTVKSDQASLACVITIMCKGKTHAKLIKRTYTIKDAVYLLLKRDETLNGVIDALEVGECTAFMAVDATNRSTAIDMDITLHWQKQF